MAGRAETFQARFAPLLLAAAGAGAYVALTPASADLSAQLFRADLFAQAGATLFNTAWFGGHHTPGYSVLFPPLAALLSPAVVGATAAVVATWLVTVLARGRGTAAGMLFAPGILAMVVSGRMTFVLGVAIGLGAILAADRGRTGRAFALGVLTALASPVAGVFAGLAGGAIGLSREERAPGMGLAAGTLAAAGVLVVAFPAGGTFPFAFSSFLPAAAVALLVLVLAPRQHRELRTGAVLYLALCLAAFAIPSPMGGNAARMGTLVAAPLAWLVLWPHRRLVLAALALPIAYLVLQPPVRDVARAHADPLVDARYHQPLIDRFAGRAPVRVEIPATQNHGEAFHVALRIPIARGWERQVDRKLNPLFYDDGLTPRRYAAWLRANAVSHVALPTGGVRLDPSAVEEARLIRYGVPGLTEVAAAGRWRIFRVTDPLPLAQGAGRLTRLAPSGFDLRVRRAGSTLVRVRYTPYWAVADGAGCVEPAPGGWTRVRTGAPGTLEVRTAFALDRVGAHRARCREP